MGKKYLLVIVFSFMFMFNIVGCKKDSAHHGAHWTYSGSTGPLHWGDLKPEYITCKIGKNQTPINIDTKKIKFKKSKDKLTISYTPAQVTVVNNGHTIQADFNGNSFIEYVGKKYSLIQFHFHAPSEEQIDGNNAAMVAHLVHKSEDNKLAVIAVLFKQGDVNPFIEQIWGQMPETVGGKISLSKALNANAILPQKKAFWTFTGSLTTPPCSEGVTWFVMQNQATISDAQLKNFTALYPNSNRPVQPLHGREISESK